jgi:hypothetical protein
MESSCQTAASDIAYDIPSTQPYRNFDDPKELFEERIYGSIKGQYRLDMVLEDIQDALLQDGHVDENSADQPLQATRRRKRRLVDIGGGLGQVSLHFAFGRSLGS